MVMLFGALYNSLLETHQ